MNQPRPYPDKVWAGSNVGIRLYEAAVPKITQNNQSSSHV